MNTQEKIKNYFDSLECFEKGHIIRLCNCLTFEDVSQREAQKKLFDWLIDSYLCFTGQKANNKILILTGKQGIYKTSFLNFLCPIEIFNRRHFGYINLDKDDIFTRIDITQKIFINIDDQINSFTNEDYEGLNSLLLLEEVKEPYKSDVKKSKRIANFCASSTNPITKKLPDNYIILPITNINPAYQRVDIYSMWAEVRELVNCGVNLINK